MGESTISDAAMTKGKSIKTFWQALQDTPPDWGPAIEDVADAVFGQTFDGNEHNECNALIGHLRDKNVPRALQLQDLHNAAVNDACRFGAIIGYALAKTWPQGGIEELGEWPARALAFIQSHHLYPRSDEAPDDKDKKL